MREAALRVGRSKRTIEAWIRDEGLTATTYQGRRYVLEHELLAIYRRKLQTNPNRPRRADDTD